MTLTAELFARSGRALFGDEWQNPLADLLDMNPRTVRRIAKAAREGEAYAVNQSLAHRLHLEMQRRLARDGEEGEARVTLSRELYDVVATKAIEDGQNYAKVMAGSRQFAAAEAAAIEERAHALHAQCGKQPFDELHDDLKDAYRRHAKADMEADGDAFAASIWEGAA